jgi:hypothetical protein
LKSKRSEDKIKQDNSCDQLTEPTSHCERCNSRFSPFFTIPVNVVVAPS